MDVTVAMIVAGEPISRLERALSSVSDQEGAGTVEVLIAAPFADIAGVEQAAANVGLAATVVVNPSGRRTTGLNLLLARAAGPVFARLDARSRIPTDYLARCAARLARDAGVGVVGGMQLPARPDRGVSGAATARALRNPLALGAPSYRRLDAAGPVDTVYLGVFRTEQLRALGGFDERLDANEDFDVAERYRRNGSVVWLEGGLAVQYEARVDAQAVLQQYWRFGRSKATYWLLGKGRPNRRQMAALGGAAAGTIVTLARPRWGVGVLGTALLAVAAADHRSGGPEDGTWVRVKSTVLALGLPMAWVAGVLAELIKTGWQRASRGVADASLR